MPAQSVSVHNKRYGYFSTPGFNHFQVYRTPLPVKADFGWCTSTKRIKKNMLAISVVMYYLAVFDSSLYWSSSMSIMAALSDAMTNVRP